MAFTTLDRFTFLLQRALKLHDFFDLAKASPKAEKPVTQLIVGYIMDYDPQLVQRLDGLTKDKDRVAAYHSVDVFAQTTAKWIIRKLFKDQITHEEESKEDQLWEDIQLCAMNVKE